MSQVMIVIDGNAGTAAVDDDYMDASVAMVVTATTAIPTDNTRECNNQLDDVAE